MTVFKNKICIGGSETLTLLPWKFLINRNNKNIKIFKLEQGVADLMERNLPAILKWSLQQQTEDPSPQQAIDPEVKIT